MPKKKLPPHVKAAAKLSAFFVAGWWADYLALKSADVDVRVALIEQAYLSTFTMKRLLKDPDERVTEAMFQTGNNGDHSYAFRRHVARHGTVEQQKAMLGHYGTPKAITKYLVSNGSPEIVRHIADKRCRDVPAHKFTLHPDREVRLAYAGSFQAESIDPNETDVEVIATFFRPYSSNGNKGFGSQFVPQLVSLYKAATTSGERAQLLDAAGTIATYCDTEAAETLWGTFKQDDVRDKLVANENCPPQILVDVIESHNNNSYMKMHVMQALQNPNCPVDVLETLAGSSDATVRIEVASNRKTPSELVEKMLFDDDKRVMKAAMENPQCSPEALALHEVAV